MSRKKNTMTIMNVKADPMFENFAISQKNALKGIGPKTKKKQIHAIDIIGEDSLELVGEEKSKESKTKDGLKSGKIDWKEIKINPDIHLMNQPIEEWEAKHLFVYFRREYNSKYPNIELEVNKMNGSRVMKNLKSDFNTLFYIKPSSQIIKDYLDWFINNKLNSIMSKYNKLYIENIRQKSFIHSFYNQYKAMSLCSILPDIKASEPVSFCNMNDLFKASRINFIMKYGIVITVNWLINNKKINVNDAENIVKVILKETTKEGKESINKIISTTKSFSPYPINYDISCLTEILNSIGMNECHINFSKNVKDYLEKEI